MFEFWTGLFNNPMAVPIIAIVVGVGVPVTAHYWFEREKHREDSQLKRAMIERGLSVDEIERVLAAKSTGDEEAAGSRKWSGDRAHRAAAR